MPVWLMACGLSVVPALVAWKRHHHVILARIVRTQEVVERSRVQIPQQFVCLLFYCLLNTYLIAGKKEKKERKKRCFFFNEKAKGGDTSIFVGGKH